MEDHKSEYATNHFAFNRWILKYAGLWTPNTKSKILYVLYKFYAILVFLFVNLFFTATEFLSIMETKSQLDLLIKNINFALTHLMGAVKCIFWFSKGDELQHIIKTLEDEKFHYETAPDFDPGEVTKKAKKIGFKYTLSFFMLAQMTLSSSYFPAIIATIVNPNYIEDETGNLTFSQPLPYFSWMPFSIDTPGNYLLGIFYQAGPMWSYAFSIVGMDTLFMNIMNYIGAHLLILKGAFRTIRVRCTYRIQQRGNLLENEQLRNIPELEYEMKKEMKKCVIHLQTVIDMCDKLENLHKYLTLGQILATLFILCTSLFLVSSAPIASKQFAAESVYMIAMGFQLVLYCWFGNQVTLRATEIPQALWENDWLETQKSFKSSMMITMIRMRKPLYLTVGKFAPLTLTTFVAILKGSYSFFAVLKKVND